jgi:hypothetical protein
MGGHEMRHFTAAKVALGGAAVIALLLAAPLSPVASAANGNQGAGSPSGDSGAHHGPNGETDVDSCSPDVGIGYARCFAHVRTDAGARSRHPVAAGDQVPAGTLGNNGAYDPSFLQSAYNTPSKSSGVGQTVAIVDAYDDPNAASDMAYYRSYFGLPTCTTTNGCFTKVNESGTTGSYPQGNSGWAQEISLDLDMVSAICPNCHILLVEATTNSIANLGTAVNAAVRLGASVVTNSYGGGEYTSEVSDATAYYDHPGVAITAASGDSGYGVEFPAAAPTVTAVGGTTLNQATNTGTRNATETAWSGAGSGCSAYEPEQTWQTALRLSGCSQRMVTDVSAVADPNTGVWVYDTYGLSGFAIIGGTSVSTQIVGAVYALADNPSSTNNLTSYPYKDTAALNYIDSGSNGTCSVSYLCTAGPGSYNGPTGLGTPNGTAAFTGAPSSPTVPSAPQNLTATAGNAAVSLSWQPPASNGGSTITGYDVYEGTSSKGESSTPVNSSLITGTSDTVTGLTNGTPYFFTVEAVNGVGNSLPSNEVSATPSAPSTATVPGAPQHLTAAPSSTKGVALAWNAPASNGGASITGYTLYRSTNSGRETAYATVSCTAKTCTYNDSGTRSRTIYYYTVAAINPVGTGPQSNQASASAK